jgi:predicted transcriptional regulator
MIYIKEYKEFNEEDVIIEYKGPIVYHNQHCIEAFHNDKMVGQVIFKISDDDPPYHEVVIVNQKYRGQKYEIAFKLKLLAILYNKKSYYYTKDLTPKGRPFVEKYVSRGIWKLDEDYEKGKLISLTEKGKKLAVKYGKELLNIDFEFEK